MVHDFVFIFFGDGDAVFWKVYAEHVEPELVQVNGMAAFATSQVKHFGFFGQVEVMRKVVHENLGFTEIALFVKNVVIRRIEPGNKPIISFFLHVH